MRTLEEAVEQRKQELRKQDRVAKEERQRQDTQRQVWMEEAAASFCAELERRENFTLPDDAIVMCHAIGEPPYICRKVVIQFGNSTIATECLTIYNDLSIKVTSRYGNIMWHAVKQPGGDYLDTDNFIDAYMFIKDIEWEEK